MKNIFKQKKHPKNFSPFFENTTFQIYIYIILLLTAYYISQYAYIFIDIGTKFLYFNCDYYPDKNIELYIDVIDIKVKYIALYI